MRELRQNVRFPFSLAPDSDPSVRLLYHRYGRFSKSIRPDEVGACQLHVPLPHPFLGYCLVRVTTCALCRKIVKKIVNTDTCHGSFFFHSLVCGACKTGTLHPLFTVRSKRSSKMTANGRMAATSPRGTSCHLGRLCFSFVFGWLLSAEKSSYPNTDSPSTIVPERMGMRMPGSFGDSDGDEEAVDKLILGIGGLGVKDD